MYNSLFIWISAITLIFNYPLDISKLQHINTDLGTQSLGCQGKWWLPLAVSSFHHCMLTHDCQQPIGIVYVYTTSSWNLKYVHSLVVHWQAACWSLRFEWPWALLSAVRIFSCAHELLGHPTIYHASVMSCHHVIKYARVFPTCGHTPRMVLISSRWSLMLRS